MHTFTVNVCVADGVGEKVREEQTVAVSCKCERDTPTQKHSNFKCYIPIKKLLIVITPIIMVQMGKLHLPVGQQAQIICVIIILMCYNLPAVILTGATVTICNMVQYIQHIVAMTMKVSHAITTYRANS